MVDPKSFGVDHIVSSSPIHHLKIETKYQRFKEERKKEIKKEKYAVFQKCVLALSGTFADI